MPEGQIEIAFPVRDIVYLNWEKGTSIKSTPAIYKSARTSRPTQPFKPNSPCDEVFENSRKMT